VSFSCWGTALTSKRKILCGLGESLCLPCPHIESSCGSTPCDMAVATKNKKIAGFLCSQEVRCWCAATCARCICTASHHISISVVEPCHPSLRPNINPTSSVKSLSHVSHKCVAYPWISHQLCHVSLRQKDYVTQLDDVGFCYYWHVCIGLNLARTNEKRNAACASSGSAVRNIAQHSTAQTSP
jgi:hypothetical protein